MRRAEAVAVYFDERVVLLLEALALRLRALAATILEEPPLPGSFSPRGGPVVPTGDADVR